MAIENIGLYPITIDVYKKHKESTVYANDNDMNGRGLLINLAKNNASFDSTGITLKIGFRNAVGEERLYDCDIVDVLTGQYKVFYPTEMLVGNGGRVVKLEIKAYESTGALLNYSPVFVYVHQAEVSSDAIGGTNETNTLVNALSQVQNIDNRFNLVNAQLAQNTQRLKDSTFNIKDFGAKGDGVTNDTVAFQNLSNAVNIAGGGTIMIPHGEYLVGKQTYRQTGELAWIGENILNLTGGDSIVIEGNNAKIKLIDNMRIGHFNQSTGEPLLLAENEDVNTKNSFVNNMFNIHNYKRVEIKNLELNGQCQTYNNDGSVKTSYIKGVLALRYGDGSYKSAELGAHGLELINNDSVIISNCEIHHFGVDGIYIGNQIGETIPYEFKDYPVMLNNLDCHHNGRQGLSWAGGKGLTAISCKFNHTGKAGIEYEPAAGLDVESNEGKVEDGFFLNCEFANNLIGVLSTGTNRNLRFEKCRIFGTTGQSVRIYTPRTRFIDCLISGEITECYYGTKDSDKTHFIDCTISGEHTYHNKPIFGARLFNELSELSNPPYTSNPIFDNCTFITGDKALFNSSGQTITTVKNCHIIKNNEKVESLRVKFEGNNIIEDSGSILFNDSLNNGKLKYNSETFDEQICDENGIWISNFKTYYFHGTDTIKIPNYACSFVITAYQFNDLQKLIAVGSKPGTNQDHLVSILSSDVLTIGAGNSVGTQTIDGFTDLPNAHINLQVFATI